MSKNLRAFAALATALLTLACANADDVRLTLRAQPIPERDPRALEIRAQVTGPTDRLRYRWYAVSGECEPQVSDSPETAFRFAEGSTKDRVTVEVWRGEQRVAQRELDVQLRADPPALAAGRAPEIAVEITKVPPYEPGGGDATRADIAGRVRGEVASDYQVVIYARADAWYIQPHSHTLHPIGADGTWSSWTHTGSSYAALVVRPGFDALTRLDVLPQVGGYVAARTIAEGVRR